MLKSNIDRLLQDGPGGTARRNIALPKLSLKEFDGRNWDDFWPLFESTIHADTDLDYVQKMSYLDSLLRGEAKKVIQGLLPFSRENYELSVSLLKDKYGKNENLIRDLHNQLARLQISKSIGDDMKLQLELERVCRQLEHYNQDLSSPQIYMSLEPKLSKKVLIRYVDLKNTKMSTMPHGSNWTTDLFRDTFKGAIEQLQQINDIVHRANPDHEHHVSRQDKTKNEEKEPTLNFAVRYRDRKSGNNRRSPVAVKPKPWRVASISSEGSSSRSGRTPVRKVGSPWPKESRRRESNSSSPSPSRSRSPSRFPCQFCAGKHFELDCDKFSSVMNRQKQIELKAKCYICLFNNHMARNCPRKLRKCFLCQRTGHHPALCEKRRLMIKGQVTTITSEERSEKQGNTSTNIFNILTKELTNTASITVVEKIVEFSPNFGNNFQSSNNNEVNFTVGQYNKSKGKEQSTEQSADTIASLSVPPISISLLHIHRFTSAPPLLGHPPSRSSPLSLHRTSFAPSPLGPTAWTMPLKNDGRKTFLIV
ncbi:hypothetical protein niasHT_033634 [Heterodera trifolii]|uniref:CCHC-type domain-containing protein n=1 Tax=Heterodera trifolii TaxID=157864 RepID=A0ABD2IPL6_9BILA